MMNTHRDQTGHLESTARNATLLRAVGTIILAISLGIIIIIIMKFLMVTLTSNVKPGMV